MSQTALQCKQCSKVWTRRTLLDDACPECKGEIVDITHTPNGQKFLNIISAPPELCSASLPAQNIYTTGPSSLFLGDQ